MEDFKTGISDIASITSIVVFMYGYGYTLEAVVNFVLRMIASSELDREEKIVAIDDSSWIIGDYYGQDEAENQILNAISNNLSLALALGDAG